MKNSPIGWIVIVSLLMISACTTSRFNVIKVNNAVEVPKKQGVFYNLPQTRLDITVSVTKIERIKGPYAEFAGKYLGLSNVITQNSTDYLLDAIEMAPASIPDPEQYYFIEMENKTALDPQLVLSESGILLNTGGFEQDYDEAVNFVQSIEEDNIYPDVFKYFSDLNLFEQVDTIIERVSTDTVTIEKMSFKRTLVEKTPEQKASDAADFIIKVKEARLNLISGYQEVNYDKETFTLMNQELEKLETEYQKLFTGLTFTKTLQYRFSYVPPAGKPVDTIDLFRFSNLLGVLDTSNYNGNIATLYINSLGNTTAVSAFLNKMDPEKFKRHGYYYRIPEYAEIRLMIGGTERIHSRFLIDQFGVVNFLPARAMELKFFPESSTIQKVTTGQ